MAERSLRGIDGQSGLAMSGGSGVLLQLRETQPVVRRMLDTGAALQPATVVQRPSGYISVPEGAVKQRGAEGSQLQQGLVAPRIVSRREGSAAQDQIFVMQEGETTEKSVSAEGKEPAGQQSEEQQAANAEAGSGGSGDGGKIKAPPGPDEPGEEPEGEADQPDDGFRILGDDDTDLVRVDSFNEVKFGEPPDEKPAEIFLMPETREQVPGPNCPPKAESGRKETEIGDAGVTESASVVTFLGMPDPKLHRYPLPAYDSPLDHTLHECGASGCEHFIPTERAEDISLKTIYFAPEPKIYFNNNAEQHRDKVTIDTELISQELLAVGFDELAAKSFAVVFHDKKDIKETKTAHFGGWYDPNSTGIIEDVDGRSLYHPLTIHVVFNEDESIVNGAVWHEFAHVDREKLKNKHTMSYYDNPKAQKITQRVGLGTAIGGTLLSGDSLFMFVKHTGNTAIDIGGLLLGSVLTTAGVFVKDHPRSTLWLLDREEMYARRFARDRRKLTPVSVEN